MFARPWLRGGFAGKPKGHRPCWAAPAKKPTNPSRVCDLYALRQSQEAVEKASGKGSRTGLRLGAAWHWLRHLGSFSLVGVGGFFPCIHKSQILNSYPNQSKPPTTTPATEAIRRPLDDYLLGTPRSSTSTVGQRVVANKQF